MLEGSLLAVPLLLLIIDVLGRAAAELTGTGLWQNLLPFAAVVLGLALAIAAALWAWLTVRTPLARARAWLPSLGAALLAAVALWAADGPVFEAHVFGLRTLLGGRAEAERRTLAHQVFATYRRTPPQSWSKMLERATPFESDVRRAAEAFNVDPEVLIGIGAAESGFAPRDSHDGGRGLFQITAAPASATAAVKEALATQTLDLRQTRDNAYLAAATLRTYLGEMNGDLFLALLAYNVGPQNGGLRSIMQRYGARDFVTIQPYLQHLPRDYPIRVLAAALAYRLSRRGSLPEYQENAPYIQSVGVPGLG